LFEAYLRIVAYQRRVWEACLEMFHKPAGENPLSPRMTRMDVMSIVAPDLFGALRDACVLAVNSGIACLLDPENSMKKPDKQNLVLSRVVRELGPPLGTPERSAVDADLAELQSLAEPVRVSRNKVGAHLDLSVALAILHHDEDDTGATPYPLTLVSVGQTERMMELLTRITDAVVAHFRRGYRWYEHQIAAEVDQLFSTLSLGLRKRTRSDPPGADADLPATGSTDRP
jgi:hypothetical protein